MPDIPVRPITIHTIQEAVSRSYRIPPQSMKVRCNAWRVAHPRQVAMYLARQLTGHSYPRIGHYFGDRDHSTVWHGVHKVEKRIEADPALRRRIQRLKKRVGA